MTWRFLSVAALALLGMSGRTHAGIILTAREVGADVVITGGGTANLIDLTLFGTGIMATGLVVPSGPVVAMGQPADAFDGVDVYQGLSGPSNFGSGRLTAADDATGDPFALEVFSGSVALFVPAGYVSGSTLSATAMYLNHSFADLGMTTGVHVWTWGTGVNADSFTLQIVPEPSTLALSVIGSIGLLGVAWTRRRALVAA